MEKEYKQRGDYLAEFCDKYGFKRISYGEWEKKINDKAGLLILLIEPDTIKITYFIDVQLENELKRYYIWRQERLRDFILLQSKGYKELYERVFKEHIIEMINNMHYEILFNEDYGKDKDIC